MIADLFLEGKYNSPLESSLQEMKGMAHGGEGPLGSPVGHVCVERLSIGFQEVRGVASARDPPPSRVLFFPTL